MQQIMTLKKPVGYFLDPKSNTVIAILSRTNESSDEARARVASAHGVDPATISDAPPTNPGPHDLMVDVPMRPRTDRADRSKDFSKGPAPQAMTASFEQSIAQGLRPAPDTKPNLENILIKP
jgi:hypothetical protein